MNLSEQDIFLILAQKDGYPTDLLDNLSVEDRRFAYSLAIIDGIIDAIEAFGIPQDMVRESVKLRLVEMISNKDYLNQTLKSKLVMPFEKLTEEETEHGNEKESNGSQRPEKSDR